MKKKFDVLVIEQFDGKLEKDFDENVRRSWERTSTELEEVVTLYPEGPERRAQEIFLVKYVEVVGPKCFRDPMWIVDVQQFITENDLNRIVVDAGKALKNANIGKEVWDVALSQNPEIIEMYLWAVNGEVDDEAVKTMEDAGTLDSFIEALTDMVKYIKKSLRSRGITDSMREFYENCIRNLYEAWSYGVMEEVLAKWDEEVLYNLKKESISFLEAKY